LAEAIHLKLVIPAKAGIYFKKEIPACAGMTKQKMDCFARDDVGARTMTTLKDQLFAQILLARTRVYRAGTATPLQRITIAGINAEIFIKREDISPINAYKWRGAYNCTAVAVEQKNAKTVVAASAGNHAQGVALAARMLGIQAKIFMPLTTPMMKQNAVKLHGAGHVEIMLGGDTFDQAAAAARAYCEQHGHAYIHPFDDIHTIAGQATIADELVGEGSFDFVFLQIGGGGLAAGVSSWLQAHHPATTMFGVEGVGQASMKASIAAGFPVTLTEVDTFCDGTAVKRPGDLTFEVCRESLADIITVTNEEVCAAMQQLWESCRTIPEPSGAMGLAALVQFARANPERVREKKLLAIVCGANMDFATLGLIASQSAVGSHRRRYLRLHIPENRGGLLALLEKHFSDVNVSEFQYGKTSETDGYPVVAFEAAPERIEKLFEELRAAKTEFTDVTGDADVRYRIIPYHAASFKRPLFFHVHFPERRGALRDFLRSVSGIANLCYFNYAYSGESIGRALMGFEFGSDADHDAFHALITGNTVVTCKPVAAEVGVRMLK
jgi:threonine dehydratase